MDMLPPDAHIVSVSRSSFRFQKIPQDFGLAFRRRPRPIDGIQQLKAARTRRAHEPSRRGALPASACGGAGSQGLGRFDRQELGHHLRRFAIRQEAPQARGALHQFRRRLVRADIAQGCPGPCHRRPRSRSRQPTARRRSASSESRHSPTTAPSPLCNRIDERFRRIKDYGKRQDPDSVRTSCAPGRKSFRLRHIGALPSQHPAERCRVCDVRLLRYPPYAACATTDLKRRMARPKNKPPISATRRNCGHTTSIPAPR